MKIIEVTVSPSGETSIQTKGYAGPECLGAAKFLEQGLGVATRDVKTAEFYQGQAATQSLPQSQSQ